MKNFEKNKTHFSILRVLIWFIHEHRFELINNPAFLSGKLKAF